MNLLKRYCISAFILLNILAILFGAPDNPYLVHTRLLQKWRLFVPEPRAVAMRYRVEITYENGTVKTWVRPYPPTWDFFARHLSYQFQKWDLAADYLEIPHLLWQDLVDFILFHFENVSHPVRQISLVREQAPVPAPNRSGYVMSPQSELEWGRYIVFTYDPKLKRFE